MGPSNVEHVSLGRGCGATEHRGTSVDTGKKLDMLVDFDLLHLKLHIILLHTSIPNNIVSQKCPGDNRPGHSRFVHCNLSTKLQLK